jgi:hypothetical protein
MAEAGESYSWPQLNLPIQLIALRSPQITEACIHEWPGKDVRRYRQRKSDKLGLVRREADRKITARVKRKGE